MKKTLKKTLSIILTILMIVTAVPLAFATDIVASGECGKDGDNLTWTLDSEGTLTISGEGAMAKYDNINMPEYGYFLPPWAGYKENIKAIVIEEGVTELGLYAFYGHTAVKDVSIADSVTAINGRVFDGCSAIEKLIIPAGVNVLECTAFQNCSSLKQIVFLGKVNFNGSYSFDNCPELREIVFVKGVTNIGGSPYPFCLTDIKATEPVIHFGGTQAEAQKAFSGIFESDRFYSVAIIHYLDNCNCSVCGEYHIFEDGVCEVCGKECNFTGEYETDENAHWSTCSDDDCNAIFKEYHSFENGICSVCEYECQHLSYVNGICNNCNYKCPHENYVEFKCDVCGLNCPHENIVDSKCLDCGLTGKVVTITMYDNYFDGWNGNAVVISKLLADGSYEEIDTVTYDYGNQSTHDVIIGTDDSFVLTWIEGYADYDSTFEVAVDGETVFESEYFYNYEDGEVVYIYCKHTFEKDVCTVCGYECNHDWSNLDGICANGCGYECPHEWGEGVLTRPTFETAGYYTYTCALCGHSYTEPTKKADTTALNDASMKVMDYISNNTLTQEAANEIHNSYLDILKNNGNIFDEFGFVRGDLVEEDQPAINAVTEELQKIIDEAEEKIASGEYVKADYTEIDEAIDDIEEKLASENVTDEGKAELEEIKKQLEEMKADENTSAADVAELEKALSEYEAEVDEGIADGSAVKVDGLAIINELNSELTEKLIDDHGKNALEEFYAGLSEEAYKSLEDRGVALFELAASLTGSVKENEEKIAELKAELHEMYTELDNCLNGTHNGLEYTVTEEAKCGVNAIESATCTLCGETDEREVEGTALSHSFTKYEVTEEAECGKAGKEVAYCDHGCQTTDEREIPALEHIFLDYVSNGDATCTADGTKTASCLNGCGTTDTVADEGTMLDHTDEDGDKLCDDCGEEVYDRCDICGGKAHGDDKIQLVFCMIITIIRFVTSILKSIN